MSVGINLSSGMDIKQGLSAIAAVTLGKDMTFRDYAQGAFRMRGIGKGQRVQVKERCRVCRDIEVLLCQYGSDGSYRGRMAAISSLSLPRTARSGFVGSRIEVCLDVRALVRAF